MGSINLFQQLTELRGTYLLSIKDITKDDETHRARKEARSQIFHVLLSGNSMCSAL
jgi:hypothetical protein